MCRAFADCYTAKRDGVPAGDAGSRYFDRLVQAYPIHPEVFDRLYEDWSTLDNFQRTRGVLKLMAKVIHRLWKDGNNDLLIMPGSLPLYDADVRNEVIYYLPPGLGPGDRKRHGRRARGDHGDREQGTALRQRAGLPPCGADGVPGQRARARTNQAGAGPGARARAARRAFSPASRSALFKDALRRLGDRLHYLNHATTTASGSTRGRTCAGRWKTASAASRTRRTCSRPSASACNVALRSGVFGGTHVFTDSGDVPDDWALRLVVLPPDAAFSKSGQSLAIDRAAEILKKRGDQPRFRQNRLIFLAADYDSVSRLKDHDALVLGVAQHRRRLQGQRASSSTT